MLPPVDDKTSATTTTTSSSQQQLQQQQQRNINLSLNLNNSNNNESHISHNNLDVSNLRDSCDEESDENTKLLKSERKFDNDNNKKEIISDNKDNKEDINNKKFKFGSKTGCTKSTTLKR